MSIKNVIVSAFAVAAFSTVAMAQGGGQPNPMPRSGDADKMNRGARGFGGDRGFGMRGMGRMDFARLNLTDAQKVRVQALMENLNRTRQTNQTQFQEMGRLMRLKREGLLTTEQGTRLTALEAQMKTNGDRMQSELLAILTPEQRTIFEQSNNRGDRMRGGRGDRMRGRGDGMIRRAPGDMNRPGGTNGAPPMPQNKN